MRTIHSWSTETQPVSPLKILIIDDEENIIDFMKLGLRYEGFWVDGALNGEQGLAVAQVSKPHLVIVDTMMPGIDGLEVCRRLRTDSTTKHIPIVMLTVLDGEENRAAGIAAGADAYVTKPFDFEELLDSIHILLPESHHRPKPLRIWNDNRLPPGEN